MARWIIPDVEPEAREAAKLAARKAGLSVGDWLTQTILSAAANELKSSARGMGGSRNPYYSPPPALTPEAVLEAIQKLSTRIEAAESRTQETLAPLAEKVSHLSTKMEEVQSQSNVSTAPVERAVSRLAERLDRMEDTSHGRDGRERGRKRGFFSRIFSD